MTMGSDRLAARAEIARISRFGHSKGTIGPVDVNTSVHNQPIPHEYIIIRPNISINISITIIKSINGNVKRQMTSHYLRFSVLLSISLLAAIYFFPTASANQAPEKILGKPVGEIAQIAILPEHLKPAGKPHKGGRRLIFIGDVHGSYNELVSLLEKVKYKSTTGSTCFAYIY